MISILHVVIGEIVPKSYTLPRAESVALAVAVPIRIFFFAFNWFITFLDWLAQLVMRVLGIKTTDEMEGAHSEVELRMLLRQGERSGVLEPDEQEMIDKVFDFSDTPVEHVMVPRPDIVALPVALTPRDAMEQVLQHPYTRYPVYGDEFDDVLGILHVRRLFVALQNGGGAATDLRSLVYPAHLVPETKRLGQLLAEIRRQQEPHGDRRRRVRLGRRPRRRSRTCSRRSSARSTTSSIPRTRRSCGSGPTATASRAASRSRSSTSASSATSRTRTTTPSAASSSASSGARLRSATASRSATSSSTSPPSTARGSCTPTRR